MLLPVPVEEPELVDAPELVEEPPPAPPAPVVELAPVVEVLVASEPPLPVVVVLEVDSEEPQAKRATAEAATKRT